MYEQVENLHIPFLILKSEGVADLHKTWRLVWVIEVVLSPQYIY